MRAISVRQPWASAIIHDGKTPENRSRNIAGSYRGPVAIHASKAPACLDEFVAAAQLAGHTFSSLVLGAIIGVVDLVDVHHADDSMRCCGTLAWDSPQVPCSPWAAAGQHHLVVANPRPLTTPIPARGALGLWTPPPTVVDQIREQVPA